MQFFFIPGVPKEAKYMLSRKILPKIIYKYKISNRHDKIATFFIFGLSEFEVNNKLLSLGIKFPNVKLGIYIKFPEIQLEVYKIRSKTKLSFEQLSKIIYWIKEKVGPKYIVSSNNKQMVEVVGNLLKERNETLALAESCTGGLIGNYLTDIPGSSDYFIFSAVTYSNESKINLLGVKSNTIKIYGAVNEKTAIEMAINARTKGNSTYGLSTSGVAGPAKINDENSVGTVYIGFASSTTSYAKSFNFPFNNRRENKKIFSITALNILRKELIL